MKKINLILFVVGFALIFTACKKEEIVRLEAEIEEYTGQKAFIDGDNFSCFSIGDKINVNGNTVAVSQTNRGGRSIILDVEAASVYKAVFPYKLATSLSANSTTNIPVDLPTTQTYIADGQNVQVVNIPMCGQLTSGNGTIHFHNLCALLKLNTTNNLSDVIAYDSIEISTTNCPLSGSGYIDDISSATPSIVMNSTSKKMVTLVFNSRQTLSSNASISYYVVIPKAANAANFTVSLIGQGSNVDARYFYERTKTTALNFKRNVIYMVALTDFTPKEKASHYFTVSSTGKKVIFSPGNLQWSATNGGTQATEHGVAGGSTAEGTWRFSEHQWDFVGNASYGNVYANNVKCDNSKISATYTGWIDLFGWGTSGFNSKYPYMVSTRAEDYASGTHTSITGTNYDWGVYNDIYNHVRQAVDRAGTWRTPTSEEWKYLLHNRGSGLMGVGRVDGKKGVILLPDNWVKPSGASFKAYTYQQNVSNYGDNTYTIEQWKVMESSGAIFVPDGYNRNGTDVYDAGGNFRVWSSTSAGGQVGWLGYLYVGGTTQSQTQDYKYLGEPVRLVKDYTGE